MTLPSSPPTSVMLASFFKRLEGIDFITRIITSVSDGEENPSMGVRIA